MSGSKLGARVRKLPARRYTFPVYVTVDVDESGRVVSVQADRGGLELEQPSSLAAEALTKELDAALREYKGQ